jgi:hypothetical protein
MELLSQLSGSQFGLRKKTIISRFMFLSHSMSVFLLLFLRTFRLLFRSTSLSSLGFLEVDAGVKAP